MSSNRTLKNPIHIDNDFSDNEFLLTLKTSGRSRKADDFNILEEFVRRYNEKPFTLRIINEESSYFAMDKIRELIKLEFPNSILLFKDEKYSFKHRKILSIKEIWLIEKGFIMTFGIEEAENVFNNPKLDIGLENQSELIEYNELIHPSNDSELYDINIINKIIEIFDKAKIIENIRPTIGMISMDNGDLYLKDFSIGKRCNIKYMNLHYGDNFTEFNKKLLKKLKYGKKGLVLLHGESGTGKTHYTRYLLSRIYKTDKSVLYFPSTMVSAITDPSFITFINDWVSENNKSCILLIEDAEPLLVARDTERNIGITNLLNLTDGLLNDIFGIQIIATFNTSLDELDPALLRPERLIARKEFKKLSKERALELADKIKIDKSKIKDEMTLADIYAIKQNNEIILHNVEETRKKIGF